MIIVPIIGASACAWFLSRKIITENRWARLRIPLPENLLLVAEHRRALYEWYIKSLANACGIPSRYWGDDQ
jgi:hypothetical protein